MKRVAVIAIFMAVMASLFAFPVFAESPVQPLQVVTYSDTSTQLRISGTAERLHYNVDSFQVVFTNPPNNYGTACTPVLVSFRFYNSSDLPAYVGQAEFEIVCTNGTGSTNLIIYGYDQISTDLFVAESSYSTSEVGRIGIGASNDFAYYTGFVVPPKTSLYFSAIVYVNASAYEGVANVTGSQEQVNQLTMSSLNLYTNQISFSSDYPYNNMPIDFGPVLDTITELIDTVSTSSEMQDLIDAITYTGSNPGYNLSNSNGTYVNKVFSNDLTVQVYRFISNAYLIDSDVELDSSNDSYIQNGTVRYDITIIVNEIVSNKSLIMSPTATISGILPNGMYNNFIVDEIFSDSFLSYNLNSNRLTLQRKNTNIISYRFINTVGPHLHVIKTHLDLPYGTDISFPTLNVDSYTNYYTQTDIYAPISEYYILRDLYLAYQSVNGLDDIDNTADDIKDKSESAHTLEQSYFTQNAQAIQQTGLSNYRFNGDQENGISSVSHDFILLWNALGGFNSIYIFSLTLSLALMILRHAPGAIRSSRRNKEE